MKSIFITLTAILTSAINGQWTPNGVQIDPTTDIITQASDGYGAHFIVDEGVMTVGTKLNTATNQVVGISYEYNSGTGQYDQNPQTFNAAGTRSGWALGYSESGWIITGGGTSDKPQWWKYEGGAWVKKFEVTGFPTDCPAELTLQAYDDKMDAQIRQCRTVAIDKTGTYAIIIPQNGWARVYRRVTDTNWAIDTSIKSGVATNDYGYNNLYIHSAMFCGPDDTHLFLGGQWDPAEIPVYTRTGNPWNNVPEKIQIPISPHATNEDVYTAYDMKCDRDNNGTQAIAGMPNDESMTVNGDYIGSAHIMELIDGTWTVTASLRDGDSDGRFGARVAINGRWAAVAEPQWVDGVTTGYDHGRVHVYYKNADTDVWEHVNYIVATNPAPQDYFGRSLQITSDGTIYAGGYVNTISGFVNAGRIATYLASAPTPPPTPAPTPNPYIVVGTAEIKYDVKEGAAREQVTQTTITDVKAGFSDPESLDVSIKSTEIAYNPITVYQTVDNQTLYKESYAKARGCWPDCIVSVTSVGGNRRVLVDGRRELQTDVIEIELTFDLTESAYNDLVSSGNNLDSQDFLDDLASELGVSADNITVTIVSGEVVVEVALLAQVTDEPSGQDSLDDIAEIKASLDNATTVLVEELGAPEDSVTTVELDLCNARDCNGYGDSSAEGTDENGCIIATGACACLNDRWGINCETECECEQGAICRNSICHCTYPYYGLKCQLEKTTDCNACFN